MLKYCRWCTSLVMSMAQGLVHRRWKVDLLVIGLECKMRMEMEQDLITESVRI